MLQLQIYVFMYAYMKTGHSTPLLCDISLYYCLFFKQGETLIVFPGCHRSVFFFFLNHR